MPVVRYATVPVEPLGTNGFTMVVIGLALLGRYSGLALTDAIDRPLLLYV